MCSRYYYINIGINRSKRKSLDILIYSKKCHFTTLILSRQSRMVEAEKEKNIDEETNEFPTRQSKSLADNTNGNKIHRQGLTDDCLTPVPAKRGNFLFGAGR